MATLCPDQALAAIMADGGLAVVESVRADLWEETLDAASTSDSHGLTPGVLHLPVLRRQSVR